METTDRPLRKSSLEIGDCRLEPALLRLRRAGQVIRLEPRAVELLLFLAERAPQVVSRAEIFEHVWQGRAVVDETLTRCVSLLRQAFGDSARDPRYIETIPRRGYRLLAEVRQATQDSGAENPEVETPPNERKNGNGAESRKPALPSETSANEKRPRARKYAPALLVAILVVIAAGLWSLFLERTPSLSSPPTLSEPRLAVLPFENLSGVESDRYLAEGMTEELIHQLASLSGLRVVSRTSVTSKIIGEQPIAEVARQLRADYLLEGSVLAVDERIRITAQLIRPDVDEHLWSGAYDRALADVLSLHRDVAFDVARQVEAELTAPERARLGEVRTVDPEAYRLYLEGSQALSRRTVAGMAAALDLFGRAVEIDPTFADAWSALASAHMLSDPYLKVAQTVAYNRARQAIEKALEIDPNLASAYVSLGLLKLFRDWDWAGSEEAYRRAVALEPSHARAHQWLSEMLSLAGRHDEALDEVRIAVDLDPLSPLVHAAWGQRLNAAGRHREALLRFDQADALGATFSWHLREVAYAHERLGSESAALEARIDQARSGGTGGEELASLLAAIDEGGIKGYWRWQLPRLLAPQADEPVLIAEAYAALGDHEEALPWLQLAVRKRGGWFLHISKSPAFDDLRNDARFRQLLSEATPAASPAATE
ncbi:MAG: winged helix-turn-helix domain-containing protein [Thermoanaerobaculia bacterium]|nr:winged helix-turn-helix domain-containing protein [Thermoanaerobaculia bacterium]